MHKGERLWAYGSESARTPVRDILPIGINQEPKGRERAPMWWFRWVFSATASQKSLPQFENLASKECMTTLAVRKAKVQAAVTITVMVCQDANASDIPRCARSKIPLSRSTGSVLAGRMLRNGAVERISKGGLSMEGSGGIWRELDLFDARRLVSRTEYANWKGDWASYSSSRSSTPEGRIHSFRIPSSIRPFLDLPTLFTGNQLVSVSCVVLIPRTAAEANRSREAAESPPTQPSYSVVAHGWVPSKQDKSPWFISVALASRKVDYRDLGTKPKNTNVVPSAIAGFGVTRDRNVFPMSPKGYERDQCIDAEPDGAEYDEVISEFVAGSYMKMELTATFSTSLGLPLEPQNLSTHQLEKACAGFHVTGVVPVSRISHYLTIWSHPLVVSTNRIVSNSTNCPRKRFQA
ncbi:hypothetical protein EDD16DRAFT_1724738 [Pisolithus croceorrhizus]|nr:hypothetical protein EDD16DRAFT_1724738 [Pisolithus croceorrhizus]